MQLAVRKVIPTLDQTENLFDVLTTAKIKEGYWNIDRPKISILRYGWTNNKHIPKILFNLKTSSAVIFFTGLRLVFSCILN
jgi:hypothetical protein